MCQNEDICNSPGEKRRGNDRRRTLKVWIVTDPMCSWCWGMTPAIEIAMARMDDRVEFDLLMGGINTHGSQPIGEFGKRHLFKLWKDVHETTGQNFGFELPESFVYNSTVPCLAVVAMSRWLGRPAFSYLHRLQQLFFLEGMDINQPELLARTAEEFGWTRAGLVHALADLKLKETLHFEFDTSRCYGTNALPSLLSENNSRRSLIAGGYVDADMFVQLLEAKLAEFAG